MLSRLETGGLKAGCLYSRPWGWRLEGGLRTSVEAALVSKDLYLMALGDRRLGYPGSSDCSVGGLALCPGWSRGHLVTPLPPPPSDLVAGWLPGSKLPPRPTGSFPRDQASGQMRGVQEGGEAGSSFRASTSMPSAPPHPAHSTTSAELL